MVEEEEDAESESDESVVTVVVVVEEEGMVWEGCGMRKQRITCTEDRLYQSNTHKIQQGFVGRTCQGCNNKPGIHYERLPCQPKQFIRSFKWYKQTRKYSKHVEGIWRGRGYF